MTLHTMTTADKLAQVERLIRDERRHGDRESPCMLALRSIAADLRSRLEGAPSATLVDVERRVNAVARSKTRTGYDPGKLHVLGEGVAIYWPTIKQALERFGAEVER